LNFFHITITNVWLASQSHVLPLGAVSLGQGSTPWHNLSICFLFTVHVVLAFVLNFMDLQRLLVLNTCCINAILVITCKLKQFKLVTKKHFTKLCHSNSQTLAKQLHKLFYYSLHSNSKLKSSIFTHDATYHSQIHNPPRGKDSFLFFSFLIGQKITMHAIITTWVVSWST
jgi:hypothetical protein